SKQKFLPRCLMPGQPSVIRSQSRGGIYARPRSRGYKIKVGTAIIISSCALQCVTDRGSQRQETNGWRGAFEVAESQMDVNADEDQVVGNAVNDTTLPAFPMRQTRKLAVRVIECIRANMEHHPDNVDAQITIEIKVSGNDAKDAGQHAHGHRRHLQPRENSSEAKPYGPVKMKIEDSFDVARFESRFDFWRRCVNNLCWHQELILTASSDILRRNRNVVALIFESPLSVSSRMLSASSRSARVCLAVTQARKQILFCGTAG